MVEADLPRPKRDVDRALLEGLASGVTSTAAGPDPAQVGQARHELLVRDREYAEQQEQSRRDFETTLVDKQLRAASDVAWATKWAMWAAIAASLGAAVQAVMAVLSYWR
jgi:hypothetical protein